MNEIKQQLITAINDLLNAANLEKGDILIVGCSTSEVIGEKIGSNGSLDVGAELYAALHETLSPKGIFLAAQCCEHLNRAVIIEKEAARLYGLEEVNAVPHAHAGGSFATTVYKMFQDPVTVEQIKAHAGIDIGDTLIGMHLKAVAVPVRSSVKKIGQANLVMARTRPKYIGGERAKYKD